MLGSRALWGLLTLSLLQRSAPIEQYSDNGTLLFCIIAERFLLYRILIAYNSYRPEHIGPVIASCNYRSDVIDHLFVLAFGENSF
jgi:hypothetical protein